MSNLKRFVDSKEDVDTFLVFESGKVVNVDPINDLKKWWKEDADRLNRMAELAREEGAVADTGAGLPPELNPDGSLKEPEEQG